MYAHTRDLINLSFQLCLVRFVRAARTQTCIINCVWRGGAAYWVATSRFPDYSDMGKVDMGWSLEAGAVGAMNEMI